MIATSSGLTAKISSSCKIYSISLANCSSACLECFLAKLFVGGGSAPRPDVTLPLKPSSTSFSTLSSVYSVSGKDTFFFDETLGEEI